MLKISSKSVNVALSYKQLKVVEITGFRRKLPKCDFHHFNCLYLIATLTDFDEIFSM